MWGGGDTGGGVGGGGLQLICGQPFFTAGSTTCIRPWTCTSGEAWRSRHCIVFILP